MGKRGVDFCIRSLADIVLVCCCNTPFCCCPQHDVITQVYALPEEGTYFWLLSNEQALTDKDTVTFTKVETRYNGAPIRFSRIIQHPGAADTVLAAAVVPATGVRPPQHTCTCGLHVCVGR